MNVFVAQVYFLPVIEGVPKFLENLTDEELKKESKEKQLIIYFKSINTYALTLCLAKSKPNLHLSESKSCAARQKDKKCVTVSIA